MKRWSSRRFSRVPTIAVAIDSCLLGRSGVRRGVRAAHRCRLADGGDDVLVAGAAADVALDGVADSLVRGIRIVREQVGGGHDHARRAEAALQAVLLPEGLLQGMKP